MLRTQSLDKGCHLVVALFVLSLFRFHIHVLVYKLLLRSKRLRKASSRCPLLIVIKVWQFIKSLHVPTLLGAEGADVSVFSIYAIVSKNSLSFLYTHFTQYCDTCQNMEAQLETCKPENMMLMVFRVGDLLAVAMARYLP